MCCWCEKNLRLPDSVHSIVRTYANASVTFHTSFQKYHLLCITESSISCCFERSLRHWCAQKVGVGIQDQFAGTLIGPELKLRFIRTDPDMMCLNMVLHLGTDFHREVIYIPMLSKRSYRYKTTLHRRYGDIRQFQLRDCNSYATSNRS